jgi:hypothetical protein
VLLAAEFIFHGLPFPIVQATDEICNETV